jgi:mannose-6-phosphate isomerase-like protein (cupin superfamily)
MGYPYDTHLDIRFGPLERIDAHALAAATTHPWYNQTLCQVNDSVVRLGVLLGEYHWHHHDVEDELFFVLEGRFIVDVARDGGEGIESIELTPGQGFVVPHGVRHRTRAPVRSLVLMVEPRSIVPTGSSAESRAR